MGQQGDVTAPHNRMAQRLGAPSLEHRLEQMLARMVLDAELLTRPIDVHQEVPDRIVLPDRGRIARSDDHLHIVVWNGRSRARLGCWSWPRRQLGRLLD